jgi:hypothetical protein
MIALSLKASASTVTLGVKTGDWAGYGDTSFEWWSNITGHELPPAEMNMTWMEAEVMDVQNSNITLRSTVIYGNSTEETAEVWGDIATGEGNVSIMVIPANVDAGYEIPANLTWYTEEPLKLTVNGTVTGNYAGADREVNYADITYPIVYGNVTYGAWNMTFYWDKETGIMCEEIVSYSMSYTDNSTYYYGNMSMTSKMTTTNMWEAVFTAQDGYAFNVTMASNSTILDFDFNESLMQVSFNVTGPTGRTGYCNVTIPKDLMEGNPWTVYVDDTDQTMQCQITENSTHTFIYVPHGYSTHTIQIKGTSAIPEFQLLTIVPFFLLATLTAVITSRLKRP